MKTEFLFSEIWRNTTGKTIRAGLAKRKAAGLKLGAPKKIDDEMVKSLRDDGLSVRAIASRLGCSHAGVLRSIREREKRVE